MHPPSLFDTADRFFAMAPWTWMSEERLIYLRHPESGVMGYISVMGAAGHHTAMSVYLGEEAFHRFNRMQSEPPGSMTEEDSTTLLLECRQLQVVWAPRTELMKAELALIKDSGRRYRGKNWPAFRSFRPGFTPGPVDPEEAEWLLMAMEQAMAVAPALKTDPEGEFRRVRNGFLWLTRCQKGGAWQTAWTPFDARLYRFPEPEPSQVLAATVKALPALGDFECAFRLVPLGTGSGAFTTYPYFVVSVDTASDFILGMDLRTVTEQSHEELVASVPDTFLKQWNRNQCRPRSIIVGSDVSEAALRKTAAVLGIPLVRRRETPVLDSIMGSMLEAMTTGRLPGPPAGN